MILLLDMSAAFDSIPHRKLIEFLLSLGDTSVIETTIQLLVDREFVILNSEQVYTISWSTSRKCSGAHFISYVYSKNLVHERLISEVCR